jgi:hypothetical protein
MKLGLCRLLVFLLFVAPVMSQEKKAELPPEVSQFAFVIGEWDVQIFWKNKDGEWVDYQALWHCNWLAGGYMVHQDWDGPYLKGSEFRAWDVKKKKWLGHNFYAKQQWANTESQFVDGNMIVYITGISDDRGDFINRETYHNIATNSFEMKSDRSYDDGKTWEEGRYRLKATRKK